MSSRLKQVIYGAGFLLFFSAVLFGVYALMFRSAPTCFDNKQNGEETGVDCGGICAPCAQKYAQAPIVGTTRTFESNGKTVVVAAINNPNDDYGFNDMRYVMQAFDVSGQVIASTGGHAFIYDRKTKGERYLVDTLDVSGESVAGVAVEFFEPQVVSRMEFVEPKVSVKRSSTDIVGLKKTTEPIYIFTRTIDAKTTGDEVKKLEEFLWQKQFLKKLPDGTFDADTKAALVAYQKARSITPASGLFGPLTRAKVNAEVERVTKVTIEPGGEVSISGTIKNADIIDASEVVITGLLYDASGVMVGGSKTELDAVYAAEERPFKMLFPKAVPLDRIDTTKTRVFVDAIK